MRAILLTISIALPLLFSCLSPALADDSEQINALVRSAAEQSKAAKSEVEYAAIISICEEAQTLTLPTEHEKYFHQLQAWALNKRGEALADKAAAATDPADVAKLDEAALADFDAAVKLQPKLATAVHNRGVSLAAAGKSDEAIKDFDLAISLNPNYPNSWFNRGELHYQAGRMRQAISDYSRAIQLKPTDAGAFNSRGNAQYLSENYQAALADFGQAIRIAPSDPLGYANRADAYSDLGYWERGLQDYRKAIQLDPELARAKQGMAWVLATCPQSNVRDADLALRYAAEAAAQIETPDARYLDTLAAAQANFGQFDEAVKTAEQAKTIATEPHAIQVEERLQLYRTEQPFREPAR
ncbi:tetratricopeptide repeat protein [Blastopirellula marina]|uniref:TPR repeat protein n=1 Tax=Blastopirellula marina DSM 3645 TaxID=314230 RepID=A4A116_9BACT|nr:tetratricopeptide repeat protein [Blastopirellula marina]EAQ77583.1 TPR repeat protein [Blastopirellula marina DSM 3645]